MLPWILLGELVTLSVILALSGQSVIIPLTVFLIVIGVLAVEPTWIRIFLITLYITGAGLFIWNH